MFDYDRFLAGKLRDNKIESMYKDLMAINRLDVPDDIKYHLRHVYKMNEKENRAKWQHRLVMSELKLFAYYSWGLFQEVPGPTILDEELEKIVGAGADE